MLKKPIVAKCAKSNKTIPPPPKRRIVAAVTAGVAGVASAALIMLSAPAEVPRFIEVETGWATPYVYLNTKYIRLIIKGKDRDCFYICSNNACSLNEDLFDKFRVCKNDNNKSYKVVERLLGR